MPTFGSLLLERLESTNLSPYRLALEARVDGSMLNRVINGHRKPTDELLKKLASVPELGMSFDDLLMLRAQSEYPKIHRLLTPENAHAPNALPMLRLSSSFSAW
jgi:transcriptional regulator with XRE-family HTH domain